MSILKTENLAKKFGELIAVKGVSFEINEGEIFSLLGPNGAGKTTTISMLSTLIRPSAGNAWIGGYSVIEAALAVRKIIGVVPQEIALYDTLSARENLLFWGRMYGLSGKNLRSRCDQVLEQVTLTDRAKDRVETFSGGMKRRINIAVGLLHKPRIIFMDEPTVGIDPQSRRNILEAVKELNQQGLTVLYTTHYMEEAQELSNRVGIIDHGEMIAAGTQKELTQMVGENDTLILKLGEEEEKQEIFVNCLKQIDGVLQASSTDHQVVVMAREAEEVLAPVVSAANELGIRIRSVDIREPNLEAVFLHLTGRALRD
ncbi:MAG: export ABC transporter ATP-binding protein [Chloroflexi bacterium HGW-Chloroflexi-10]|nr:MAG: export ABC transporter ATP-binding protein [Chloroflexi bacterium HGW-Chloroflexi-10]